MVQPCGAWGRPTLSLDTRRTARTGGSAMHSVIQDLRFAVRSFVRAPRFAVPALVALALGIGATSATFSVVRGVMLKPLPYDQPDRIVVVWESNLKRNRPRNVIS